MRKNSISAYLTKPVRQCDLYNSLLTVNGTPPRHENHQLVTRYSLAEETRWSNLHILLAEDNKVNQMVALSMLKKYGCRVSLANDGRQAVELFLGELPDLVLMDCQMPEMDGYQATGEIRKHEKKLNIKTPIVALTAHALEGDREKCLTAGMDDYLSKPFKSKGLQAVLDRWSLSGKDHDLKNKINGPEQVSKV
ncbi:response regulator [Desulfobacula toluolica]|uniref:Predicted response regulator n=1 Tax=Desulfobacula toluolica (strain DSM 7467 / Tol2) TaxID=651182 RepID=K0NCN5_DESTT|nr:response regulator [Desulfobacula toluolica]CCK78450.1 predicted response regulator [Desulfobacula toluolica Tol2]